MRRSHKVRKEKPTTRTWDCGKCKKKFNTWAKLNKHCKEKRHKPKSDVHELSEAIKKLGKAKRAEARKKVKVHPKGIKVSEKEYPRIFKLLNMAYTGGEGKGQKLFCLPIKAPAVLEAQLENYSGHALSHMAYNLNTDYRIWELLLTFKEALIIHRVSRSLTK